MFILQIPGPPVSWKAHGGYGKRSFNLRFEEKGYYQWTLREQYSGPLIDEACRCEYTFEMPIPSSASKKRRQKMLEGELYHTKRPDTGNLEKFLSDTLIGIVLKDDSFIVEIGARKIFAEKPMTSIKIILMREFYAAEERQRQKSYQ